MKSKPSKIIEVVFAAILVLALFLKSYHLPFAGLLLVLSAAVLSMLYFYGGFFFLRSPEIKPVYSVIYGIIFSLSLIALIFNIQRWPMGHSYLVFSLSCFAIVALVRIVLAYIFKNKEVFQYDKGIAIRYCILLVSLIYLLFS